MAVQKSKVTRSRRGQRRSHDSITSATFMADQTSGELRQRHCVGKDGFYKGRQVIVPKVKASESEEE